MAAAIVQRKAVTSAAGTWTNPTMTGVTITTGNCMVLLIMLRENVSGAPIVSTVTDTGGNHWTRVFSTPNSLMLGLMELWTTYDPSPALSAGTITITTTNGHPN